MDKKLIDALNEIRNDCLEHLGLSESGIDATINRDAFIAKRKLYISIYNDKIVATQGQSER